MMKIGLCAAPQELRAVEGAGFSYIEVSLSGLAAMEETAYQTFLQELATSSIRCEASNVMLPGTCRITGEQADHTAALAYLRGAFARAQAVGIEVAVLGSAGARKVPEGFSKEKALAQMETFARQAGDMAAQHGLRIALEPLNAGECNLLNTVAEGLALTHRVAHPAVGLLADYYHMGKNEEGLTAIAEASALLWHCHIAHPVSRRYPLEGDGAQEQYAAFMQALGSIGYDARVSVEGSGDIAAEGAKTVAFLRNLLP